MEDLIQFVFIGLFVLFGLLGGSRKKRQRRAGSTERVPERRPRPRPRPQVAPRRRIDEVASPVPHRMDGDMVDEIFRVLRGTSPEETPTTGRDHEVFEDDDEAQSVETLEPAGEKSHERFHSLYMEAPHLSVETGAGVSTRQRLDLSGKRRLRDAIILTEVLGAPKALRNPRDSATWSEPLG